MENRRSITNPSGSSILIPILAGLLFLQTRYQPYPRLLFLIMINFRLKSPLAFLAEGMLTQIKQALSGERRTRGRTNGGGDSSTGSLQLWRQTETSARVATLPQARQLRRRH